MSDHPDETVIAVGDAMYPPERQVVQMAIIRAMGEWRCWADYVDCAHALINVTRQADSLRREDNYHIGGNQRPEAENA
jgi:hypothetical protein